MIHPSGSGAAIIKVTYFYGSYIWHGAKRLKRHRRQDSFDNREGSHVPDKGDVCQGYFCWTYGMHIA